MPEAPVLSNTQRREAYERSLRVRQQRARLKAFITTATPPFRGDMMQVFIDDIAQGMKVYDLLTALPGVGKQKATAMLDTAGIPAKNTVRACGPRQRERLFDLLR